MAHPNVKLKLLIDKKGERVLFAEAGKDFVDFLFSLLTLPIGSIMGLLGENKDMDGGLTKLYQSVGDFDKDYIISDHEKSAVLKPKSLLPFRSPRVSLLPVNEWSTKTYHYKCKTCNATSTSSRSCCHSSMTQFEVEGGIVKGLVTYMVMDDLTVSPISTISSIALFHKYNIKDVGALEERVVYFGRDEVNLKHSIMLLLIFLIYAHCNLKYVLIDFDDKL
ncbi:hypothetical protein Tco_0606057 [Tanacetum coccineum]